MAAGLIVVAGSPLALHLAPGGAGPPWMLNQAVGGAVLIIGSVGACLRNSASFGVTDDIAAIRDARPDLGSCPASWLDLRHSVWAGLHDQVAGLLEDNAEQRRAAAMLVAARFDGTIGDLVAAVRGICAPAQR